MQSPYRSRSDRLYAELESRMARGGGCRIGYRDNRGQATIERARIVDVYTRCGEGFIRLQHGREIPLNAIVSVGG